MKIILVAATLAVSIHAAHDPLRDDGTLKAVTMIAGPTRVVGKIAYLGDPEKVSSDLLDQEVRGQLLRLESTRLLGLSRDGSQTSWTFVAPDGQEPVVADSDTAYLYVSSNPKDSKSQGGNTAAWKVDMKTGGLTAKFILPKLSPPWIEQSITAVAASSSGVAVLTTARQTHDRYYWEKPEECNLYLFRKDGSKVIWSKKWPQSHFAEGRGMLLASAYPNFSDASFTPLTWVKDRLLLCAAPSEPLRLLSGEDGKEETSIERIWEYRRGFIGPSVWQHFLGRNGKDRWSNEPDVSEPDKSISGKILSGPVVVTTDSGALAYVVVNRSPNEGYGEYIGDSFLYEIPISRYGGMVPLTMTPMPRYVLPQRGWVDGDAVVWPCQNGALVRVCPSDSLSSQGMGMGPGAPDRVGRIEWYREFRPKEPKAWLRLGDTPDGTVRIGNLVLRMAGSPYVVESGDSTIHFPIASVDIRSGLSSNFEMRVELSSSIPAPSTNYSGDGHSIRTIGPYHFGIGRMVIAGSRLEIIGGTEKKLFRIDFDLGSIQSAIRALPKTN